MRLRQLAGPGLALGVVLTGCITTVSTAEQPDGAAVDIPRHVSQPSVEAYYYQNGTREQVTHTNGDRTSYAKIMQFCDGVDLVEQTDFDYGSDIRAGAGNSITRTAGHVACLDGMLKPEDFRESPAVSVIIVP